MRVNKKVTIRDVAEQAGVSISTVHQALNGKRGVSEDTRRRIRDVAEQMNYQPNTIASSLKRKTRRIAVFIPGEEGGNRYYYAPAWRGVRDYLARAVDMNLECVELPYLDDRDPSFAGILRHLRELLQQGRIDGILTVGHMNALRVQEWDQIHRDGILVAQIVSDNPVSHSVCCVQPDYEVVGRTMAELILSRLPSYGSILMCAGNPHWDAHALVVQGFQKYMAEMGAENLLYLQNSWDTSEDSYRDILRQLRRPDVAACCSVLAQSSILLGRALEESGKSERLYAVASDLSEENIDRLERGVFNSIIQKNPYAQGFLGARLLVEQLVQGKPPETHTVYVGSEVVFRSNMVMYSRREYHPLVI